MRAPQAIAPHTLPIQTRLLKRPKCRHMLDFSSVFSIAHLSHQKPPNAAMTQNLDICKGAQSKGSAAGASDSRTRKATLPWSAASSHGKERPVDSAHKAGQSDIWEGGEVEG